MNAFSMPMLNNIADMIVTDILALVFNTNFVLCIWGIKRCE